MEVLTHCDTLFVRLSLQLNILQEFVSHHLQCILWPCLPITEIHHTAVAAHTFTYLKPVNGTTVNQRGKHSQSIPKSITNRTHGQNHMKVLLHSLNKQVVHGNWSSFYFTSLVGYTKHNNMYIANLYVVVTV